MGVKKNKNPRPKVSESQKHSDQHLRFSFRYITSNKHYNFSYFSDMRIKLEAENAFINRLIELSSNDWIHWSGQGKKTGFEALPFDDDMQKKFTTYDWTQGSRKQTYVFRFKAGSSDYRIIGIKENSDPTLYIIGFDFDHSAYNHGS